MQYVRKFVYIIYYWYATKSSFQVLPIKGAVLTNLSPVLKKRKHLSRTI